MATQAEIQARIDSNALFDRLTAQASKEICSICNRLLVVAWDGAANTSVLRCGPNKAHTGTKSAWEHPAQIERGQREMTYALANLPTDETGMLARIERAKFPQALTSEEKKTLALAALSYGLDPLMGELTIYQGRPYVSIDGRYRKAQETGRLAGVETRPATKAERVAWDIPDGDFFMRTEVWVKDVERPFVAWGRVRKKETEALKDPAKAGFRPLETNPQRMAEKRAEGQALRKAFSIPLPSLEDVVAEEYVDCEAREVDVATGQITAPPSPIKGEGKAIEPGPGQESSGPALPAKTPAMPVVKNWGEFAEAMTKQLGVYPNELFPRAKVNGWQDFASREQAWEVAVQIWAERL